MYYDSQSETRLFRVGALMCKWPQGDSDGRRCRVSSRHPGGLVNISGAVPTQLKCIGLYTV